MAISPYAFAQQNALLQNLLQSEEDEPAARARDQARINAELQKLVTSYKAATGQDVAPGAFLDKAFTLPAGFSKLAGDGNDQEANPTAGQAHFFTGPDGKLYIDNAFGTSKPQNQVQAGDKILTPYADANEWGLSQKQDPLEMAPILLAAAVTGAGAMGGLGAMQGIAGNGLLAGAGAGGLGGEMAGGAMDMFGAVNSPLGTGASGVLGVDSFSGLGALQGGPAVDPSWGVNPQTTAGGAMDMFGAVNSPLGTGAPGVIGVDALPGLVTPGSGLSLNDLTNVPTGGGGGGGGSTPGVGDAGAFDQFGSVNSPTGAGGGGTVFDWGSAPAGFSDWVKSLGLDPTKLALGAAKGLLDYFGSSAASKANEEQRALMWNAGAPSRARFEGSFAPGWNVMTADPSLQAGLDSSWETALRKLSTQGNPFGSPGGLMEANKSVMGGFILPATDSYRRTNLAGGQLGFSQAANFGANNAGYAMAPYNAAATGIGTALGDPMQDFYKQIGMGMLNNYKLNTGGVMP